MNSEHQYLMMAPFARFPLHLPQDRSLLTPRPWQVTTLAGNSRTTHQVGATTTAKAIFGALDLVGANSQLVACLKQGEW